MFAGFPNGYPPLRGGNPSEDILNLQKQYHMEYQKDASQYRTEFMKNMFGLVPRQIENYLNPALIVNPGADTLDCAKGDNSTTANSETNRSLQPYGKPVVHAEYNNLYPASESESPQKNFDKTQSENPSVGVSGISGKETGDSGNPANCSTEERCDMCGEVAHSGHKLTRCSECEKYFPRIPPFGFSMRPINKPKLYSCLVCDKKFVSLTTLKTHGRVHTGERPYQCSICNKTFVYEGNMKTHVRTHTGEKPFTCEKCGKSFSQSGTLKKHLRMHSGEKPFKCEFCDKTFAYSENLIPHRRVHSREKPFNCDLCKKSFSQPGSLKAHMKNMHDGDKNTFTQSDEIESDFSERDSFEHVEQVNI